MYQKWLVNVINCLFCLYWNYCILFLLLYINMIYYLRNFLFIEVWLTYNISFRCTTEWFNVYLHYKMITLIRLVIVWHHTNVLQYFWLYPLFNFLSKVFLKNSSSYYLFPFTQLPILSLPHIFTLDVYVSFLSLTFFLFPTHTFMYIDLVTSNLLHELPRA